ncbi:McrB domain protein [Fusobacterium polymorphum]|uniref:McrB domain protein n=1 Tax=Fusobacterium nucleatum subsp. polymorphum TaxID=76857 RepID=A0A1Z3CH09_FUSNP|nr:AAA family ATPase [Fusobacterium polymorphum]ASC02076.1 McrB domain protein [Fusobacterium polymorphum]
MNEVLNSDVNEQFKELIIRTLGIITRNKTQKHIQISLNPLKTLLKEYYKDEIWWRFQPKDTVPWLCFWSRKLANEPAKGIYLMFYSYFGKQNGVDVKYIVLAFGKSVKNESKIKWDSRLPLKSINDFFNELNVEELPSYKNEINYGSSMVYKAYLINQEKFNDELFHNQIFDDFKGLLDYYVAYAKYKTYEKNYDRISESKEELKLNYENEFNKIIKTLTESQNNLEIEVNNIDNLIENIKNDSIQSKEEFNFPLNTILYGPPGTGKTYNTIFYSVGIIEKDKSVFKGNNNDENIFKKFKECKNKNLIKFITFHQSYGYEDFIEGIRPDLDNESKDLKYIIHSGIFKDMCNKAKNDKENNYVLIIDEINRGNISKIFGELISLIEPSKREGESEELEVILPYSKENLTIPKNLYIIGTMNTADRSIALLDIALRRRFNFIEIMPQYDILKNEKIENIELDLLLSTINERIEFLLDREHIIGHSYFLNINTFEDLVQVFRNSIIPLLQEYFYDDFEKIKSVLGDNNFISSKNISINLKGSNPKKYIYKIDEEALKVSENYQKIYSSNEDEE